jgi:hypothetical protein
MCQISVEACSWQNTLQPKLMGIGCCGEKKNMADAMRIGWLLKSRSVAANLVFVVAITIS